MEQNNLEKKAVQLRKKGMTYKAISEQLGVTDWYVKKWCKDLMKTERSVNSHNAVYYWLQKNWHWTGKVSVPATRTEDGTRIVRKGEKGHLRTPYRTDYRFR